MRILLTLLLWSIAAPAYAVCAFPDGVEGEIVYNTTHKDAQFCNGTHWISMAPGDAPANDPRIGMLDNGKWCTSDGASVNCTQDAPEGGLAEAAGDAGQLQFNDGADALAADAALHWDNTNKRLSIGTASSSYLLDVAGNGVNGVSRATSTVIAKAAGSYGSVNLVSGSSTLPGYIEWRMPSIDGALGTRRGYLGWNSANIALALENSSNFIVNGGNVGIGTTNPTAKLQVEGGPIRAMGPIEQAAQGYDRIDFGVQDGTPRMAFDNAESPTVWLIDSEADGSFRWFVPSVVKMRLLPNGNLQIAGTYQNLSDARLKKDVRTITDAVDTLVRLRGVTFHWKDADNYDQGLQFGLIAQEVEEVLPDLVGTDSEGMKSVNYSGLVAPLIEAVKELKAVSDNLREQLAAANDNYETLRREIEALKADR